MFYNLIRDLVCFNGNASQGTKAVVLNYGEAVEIVLQATNLGAGGSHPIHLHGFSFIGSGLVREISIMSLTLALTTWLIHH